MYQLAHPLLLASASPRRHELLQQVGIDHRVVDIPSPPGEDEPHYANESPLDYVCRTAQEKAQRATVYLHAKHLIVPGQAILCADTTVELHGDVLGKPDSPEHAASILTRLSGQTHHVHTAVVLVHGQLEFRSISTSHVRFKALSADEIRAYCASGDCMGKAGAYGIQGLAATFVEHLEGSYSGVMGLPLYETAQLLQEAGLVSFA